MVLSLLEQFMGSICSFETLVILPSIRSFIHPSVRTYPEPADRFRRELRLRPNCHVCVAATDAGSQRSVPAIHDGFAYTACSPPPPSSSPLHTYTGTYTHTQRCKVRSMASRRRWAPSPPLPTDVDEMIDAAVAAARFSSCSRGVFKFSLQFI